MVAGVVGAGVYFGTKNPSPAPGIVGGEETTLPVGQSGENGLPLEGGLGSTNSTASGTITEGNKLGEVVDVLGARIIYKEPVVGFAPTPAGEIILVNKKGVVVSVSSSGEIKNLNNSEIENPLEAIFSTDGKKILLTYGKNTAPQFSVYDIASSTWQPILANVAATIKPKTHEIVYLYEKTGLKNLFVWNLDKPKSTPLQISSLQLEDPVLSWRDGDTLLIQERPTAYTKGTILAFSLSKKTVLPIIKDKYALSSIWNDEGSSGLAFYGDNTFRGGTLRLYSKDGTEGSKLSLLTLPEKCSFFHSSLYFSTTTPKVTTTTDIIPKNDLYCAIPRDSKTYKYAIMPDEYYRRVATTNDDLVKISLDDGSLSVVFSPAETQIEIYKPFATEKEIYFINRNNDALYAVPNK